jgi:hypothetical protein
MRQTFYYWCHCCQIGKNKKVQVHRQPLSYTGPEFPCPRCQGPTEHLGGFPHGQDEQLRRRKYLKQQRRPTKIDSPHNPL